MIRFGGEIAKANTALTKKELHYMDNFFALKKEVKALNNRIADLVDTANHLLEYNFILCTENKVKFIEQKDRIFSALINDTFNKVGFVGTKQVMNKSNYNEIKHIGIKVEDDRCFSYLVILPKKCNLDIPIRLLMNGHFVDAEEFLMSHKDNKTIRLQIEEKLKIILDNFDEFENKFYDDIKYMCYKTLNE